MATILENNAMNRLKRTLLALIATAGLLAASCDKNACKVPIGDARCDINLMNPDAYNLMHAGGSVYAYGGNKGLWIINTGLDYQVFEATCPHCLDTKVDTLAGWDGILVCDKCESKYSTYSDGYPLNGSAATCPLYQYACTLEGNVLHIYN